jgi:hypothetical protein
MPALAVLFPAHLFRTAFAAFAGFTMFHITFLLVDMADVLGAARPILHAVLFGYPAHALLPALCLLAFVILLLHKLDLIDSVKNCANGFFTTAYAKSFPAASHMQRPFC